MSLIYVHNDNKQFSLMVLKEDFFEFFLKNVFSLWTNACKCFVFYSHVILCWFARVGKRSRNRRKLVTAVSLPNQRRFIDKKKRTVDDVIAFPLTGLDVLTPSNWKRRPFLVSKGSYFSNRLIFSVSRRYVFRFSRTNLLKHYYVQRCCETNVLGYIMTVFVFTGLANRVVYYTTNERSKVLEMQQFTPGIAVDIRWRLWFRHRRFD